jgi:hypothetical protein
MIVVGLNLVTVALETSIEYVCNYPVLLPIIKDELCKSLMQVRFAFEFFKNYF